MDKYRGKLNWNKELEDLRDVRATQEKPAEAEPRELELVEYERRHPDPRGFQASRWLSKVGKVLLLFLVITGGVFTGDFLLSNELAKLTNDAWKQALNAYPLLSSLSDHKYTTANYSPQPSNNHFQQENDTIKHYAQLRAEQKAKERAEKQKKERAFKAFYTKPERCIDPIDHSTKMDCINEHVRARKKFNDVYAGN